MGKPLDCTPTEEIALISSEAILRDETVKLKIVSNKDLTVPSSEVAHVMVSVQPPELGERQPCDLTCIIDTSGSMGTEAVIQSAGGATESHGLSLLDVAKHGVRTIIQTLGERDRLCLVEFNHGATTVLSMRTMNQEGKRKAEEKLDELRSGGGTDIWKGLEHGLDSLRTSAERGRLGHIMLLTDGESNNKDGILPRLSSYRQIHERLPGTINTFGFGYNLDSSLLVNLAQTGSGTYSFIPDAGFVGTAFVNTLSNLLVTMAREVYLDLEPEHESGAQIVGICDSISGGFPVTQKDGYIRVDLGTLQYGQTKDIVVPMKLTKAPGAVGCNLLGLQAGYAGDSAAHVTLPSCYLVANLHYETRCGDAGIPVSLKPVEAKIEETGCHGEPVEMATSRQQRQHRGNLEMVEIARCRIMCAEAVSEAMAEGVSNQGRSPACLDRAQAVMNNAIEQVMASPASETQIVKALLEDMRGQCTEALSRPEWFQKWGRHYLPSLMFAHRLQQCNNFKDPGVQLYGGTLFNDLRDTADDIFNNLPAPKPSAGGYSRGYAQSVQSAPISMAAYNDRCCG